MHWRRRVPTLSRPTTPFYKPTQPERLPGTRYLPINQRRYSRLSESSEQVLYPQVPNRLAPRQSHTPRYPTQHHSQRPPPRPAPSRAGRASPLAISSVGDNGLASNNNAERSEIRAGLPHEHLNVSRCAWHGVSCPHMTSGTRTRARKSSQTPEVPKNVQNLGAV